MKAPDKIYIPIIEEDGKKLICTNWWETDTSSRNAYVNETIPYIRKDALLKWASQRREAVAKEVVIQEGVRLGADAAFEELIDKLNEM